MLHHTREASLPAGAFIICIAPSPAHAMTGRSANERTLHSKGGMPCLTLRHFVCTQNRWIMRATPQPQPDRQSRLGTRSSSGKAKGLSDEAGRER